MTSPDNPTTTHFSLVFYKTTVNLLALYTYFPMFRIYPKRLRFRYWVRGLFLAWRGETTSNSRAYCKECHQ